MSDTPRTDDAEEFMGGLYFVLADFARELEREFAAAHAVQTGMVRDVQALSAQLAEAANENDRLLSEVHCRCPNPFCYRLTGRADDGCEYCLPRERGGPAAPIGEPEMKVTKEMVDRFLSWKLPSDFCPDNHISFKLPDPVLNPNPTWPVGTNLFTAEQARAMLEHVLAPEAEPVAEGEGRVDP